MTSAAQLHRDGKPYLNEDGFEVTRRQLAGAPGAPAAMVFSTVCRSCEAPGEVVLPQCGANPPGRFIQRKFAEAGWRLGSTRRKDVCPACIKRRHFGTAADPAAMPTAIGAALVTAAIDKVDPGRAQRLANLETYRARLTPEQRRERGRKGGLASQARRRAKAAATPQPTATEAQPMPSPQPADAGVRKPSVQDNRRIMDALDVDYDAEAQAYRGQLTDKALGEKLNVPHAWIAGVREQLYGPERNQVALHLTTEASAVVAKIAALEARIVQALEDFDTELRRLRDELKRACARAGVTV